MEFLVSRDGREARREFCVMDIFFSIVVCFRVGFGFRKVEGGFGEILVVLVFLVFLE